MKWTFSSIEIVYTISMRVLFLFWRIPVCTKCENITIGDECQYIMECQHCSYFSNRFNITNIREKPNILKFKQEELEDTKWVIRIRISNQNYFESKLFWFIYGDIFSCVTRLNSHSSKRMWVKRKKNKIWLFNWTPTINKTYTYS
jgi:hypothetical protein